MTLFCDKTGPLLRYERGALRIEDLNPDIRTSWALNRWQFFKIGIKACLGFDKP